jgi:hypothetical protein
VVAEHDPSAILSISTTEDEHLNELVEDQPVRHSVTVAAERMNVYLPRR